MADDDEIDILGDINFSLEGDSNLLDNSPLVSQNSDLLNCDYTIHPQWLLDKPSTNPDNWYEEKSATTTPDVSDTETLGHISTENCITDESGWTEKEKNLLQRGLEIFGKSSVRLSQFIGSKTASEVKYYLKNFFTDNLNCYQQSAIDGSIDNGIVSNDILDINQIPASIEEVIAVVSTGFPTVTSANTKCRTSSTSSTSTTSSPKKPSPNKKNTVKKKKSTEKDVISKHKLKCKFKSGRRNKQKYVKLKTKIKKAPKQAKVHKKLTQTTSREISTGEGLSVPVCEGEEIVTIKRAEDDSSDISIDIENDDGLQYKNDIKPPKEAVNTIHNSNASNIAVNQETNISTSIKIEENPIHTMDKPDDEIEKQLNCLNTPEAEVVLDKYTLTPLEKYVHSDFFEGRPSRTPERYLKIRNHIISSWNSSKPNYVYKTTVRLGLKNCGDVTRISRIHYFLEQIGAINFGCKQTKYERPLKNVLQFGHFVKSKSAKRLKRPVPREPADSGSRQRIKKKFTNNGKGGCTIVHGDKGEIIDTTIVNEEPTKPKPYVKKPSIRLNYCRPFTPDKPQQYSVKINLSTLILMDFHSHSYLTEVMGLIGGRWNNQEGIMRICCYEPCKNLASSTTHCDMCPISQASAAENIHSKNFEILGWFHSHPTFPPEPSQQDLDTQQFVQQWIGFDRPCIGIILTPFSGDAALISSPFRCWMVDKKPNFEDQLVPYRFKVDIVADDFNLPEFLDGMKSILIFEEETLRDKRIPFYNPYFKDFKISHLNKFISSVNMHLAKTGILNKSACDEIIQGIRDILK